MDKIILAIRIIQITAKSSGTQLTRATKLFYKDYSRLQTLSLLSSEKVGRATRMATSGQGICIVVSYPSTLQSMVKVKFWPVKAENWGSKFLTLAGGSIESMQPTSPCPIFF